MKKEKVSEENIVDVLKKANFHPQKQPNSNQTLILFDHDGKQFPLFIRILHAGELLQLMTFIPCNIDLAHANDLSRFMHMLNKELDMPGFGMDEESCTAFYRIILPTIDKEFSPDALLAYIQTSKTVCESFAVMIEAFCIGAITLNDVLKKVDELKEAAHKASS